MTQTKPMLNPYKVRKIGKFSYSFTTNGGSNYELSFLKSSDFKDSIPIYNFNILRDEHKAEKSADTFRVRDTVISVLADFFKNTDNAIITVCDSIDGRQEEREHLFDRWYKSFGKKYKIIQAKIHTPEIYGNIPMALYYHEENMFRTYLESSIRDDSLF